MLTFIVHWFIAIRKINCVSHVKR